MSNPVQRQDPDVLPAHRKDPGEEDFLGRFNAALAPLEEELLADLPERHPTLFVVGAPRSGTTLLHQTLAAHLDLTYIHNFAAAFFRAPCAGLRLARKLRFPENLRTEYTSRHGRTEGLLEPHEFGYFWTHHLRLRELREPTEAERAAVDWAGLRRTVVNLAAVYDRPVIFKPLMLGWYMRHVTRILPRSVFLWIRRDPVQTALSLYDLRREMLGDPARWMSLQPAEVDTLRHLPAEEQIAAQVQGVEACFQREFDASPPENRLAVSYEAFCAQPAATLDALRALRPELRPLAPPPASFPLRPRDPAAHPAGPRLAALLNPSV
jgi:hypothetical protein